MATKGGRQYTNDVRKAIAKSTTLADSGTKVAASNRIKNDSQLRQQGTATRNYNLLTQNQFLDRMGVSKNKRSKTSIVANRNVTRNRHKSDVKDPRTGFGMNVNQVRRYTIITGS